MNAILACESGYNPQAINYNASSTDWSYWQINDKAWKTYFEKKGLDITDPDDNLIAGFIILKEQGIKPWKPSFDCQERQIASR